MVPCSEKSHIYFDSHFFLFFFFWIGDIKNLYKFAVSPNLTADKLLQMYTKSTFPKALYPRALPPDNVNL